MSTSILKIKKVNFEYEIIENFTAGVVLEGWMVKSIRARKVSASEGVYIKMINGEAWMMGVNITPLLTSTSAPKEKKMTSLKLLLTKKEINKLIGAEKEKGLTIVLKNLFWKGHLVKAEICLAKGKKLHDKRRTIQDREQKIEAGRAMKKAY